MAEVTTGELPKHRYHAEAKALHGEFHRPFQQVITPQALAQLHPSGGYLDQDGEAFGAQRAVSYDSAYTHVSGSQETKEGGGYCTLSTCVVVNLNILEIVTADRIVGQIFTEHPLGGFVPRISFLATRFENLRIAGHKVKLEWDLDILGMPNNTCGYTRDERLLESLKCHTHRICDFESLPGDARKRYTDLPKKISEKDAEGKTKETEVIECSLVTGSRGKYPGQSCGHVIHVPDFGDIYLATVKVTQMDFSDGVPHNTMVELRMIEAKLGCAATGTVHGGVCITNGNTTG